MKKIIFKLIGLAREFSKINTVSMHELLQQINYVDVASQISEQDLFNELLSYPEYADDWLKYSEDKRCAGWYFKLGNNGKYLVGCLGEDTDIKIDYESKLKACASFLKNEFNIILRS